MEFNNIKENEIKLISLLKNKKFYICNITKQLFEDPVVINDGYTYERSAIEKWLKFKKTSPLTNEQINEVIIIPDYTMKGIVESYKEKVVSGCISLSKQMLMRRENDNKVIKQLLERAIGFNIRRNEIVDLFDRSNIEFDMKNMLIEKGEKIRQLSLIIESLKKKINKLELEKIEYSKNGMNERKFIIKREKSIQLIKNPFKKPFLTPNIKKRYKFNKNFF